MTVSIIIIIVQVFVEQILLFHAGPDIGQVDLSEIKKTENIIMICSFRENSRSNPASAKDSS